jgi:hypothetical protein
VVLVELVVLVVLLVGALVVVLVGREVGTSLAVVVVLLPAALACAAFARADAVLLVGAPAARVVADRSLERVSGD